MPIIRELQLLAAFTCFSIRYLSHSLYIKHCYIKPNGLWAYEVYDTCLGIPTEKLYQNY